MNVPNSYAKGIERQQIARLIVAVASAVIAAFMLCGVLFVESDFFTNIIFWGMTGVFGSCAYINGKKYLEEKHTKR